LERANQLDERKSVLQLELDHESTLDKHKDNKEGQVLHLSKQPTPSIKEKDDDESSLSSDSVSTDSESDQSHTSEDHSTNEPVDTTTKRKRSKASKKKHKKKDKKKDKKKKKKKKKRKVIVKGLKL